MRRLGWFFRLHLGQTSVHALDDLDIGAIQTPHRVLAQLERGSDGLLQHRELEGLVEERVRAVQRRGHLVQGLPDGGQHHDPGVSQRYGLANAPAHLPPAHPRHHDVEHDQIGEMLVGHGQSLVSICRFNDSVAT